LGISFFVIAGKTTDEIYSGYRRLTGETPLLPKAAYGYIQCKQRYLTQDEVTAAAKGYRDRNLPADVMVVDWFYYTRMGQMDFIPEKWPDPLAMNRQLHDLGFETMISVWPRFTKDSRYYDLALKNGWFTHLADGTPIDGLPYDRAGSDIDTTYCRNTIRSCSSELLSTACSVTSPRSTGMPRNSRLMSTASSMVTGLAALTISTTRSARAAAGNSAPHRLSSSASLGARRITAPPCSIGCARPSASR
jgi:hypothetical protein